MKLFIAAMANILVMAKKAKNVDRSLYMHAVDL